MMNLRRASNGRTEQPHGKLNPHESPFQKAKKADTTPDRPKVTSAATKQRQSRSSRIHKSAMRSAADSESQRSERKDLENETAAGKLISSLQSTAERDKKFKNQYVNVGAFNRRIPTERPTMKASKSAVGLKTTTAQHIYEYQAVPKKENAYEEKKSESETKDDKLSSRSGGDVSDERKYGDSINLNLDISRTHNNIMNESNNLNFAESVNEVDEETADLTKIYSQKSGSTMSKSSKSMYMNATASTLAKAAHGAQGSK